MAFVVRSLACEELYAVWVVVDRLSKMQYFIPCHSTPDALRLAESLIREVVHLDGLPLSIVSDIGPQFASTFWGHKC